MMGNYILYYGNLMTWHGFVTKKVGNEFFAYGGVQIKLKIIVSYLMLVGDFPSV
jgi:hypothetical protein